jgi:hypothetical protein
MAYLLGWSVIPQMLIRRERWPGGYKNRGTPLVYPGQEVMPDQPVIRMEKANRAERAEYADAMTAVPRLSLPVISSSGSGSLNGTAGTNRVGETIPAGLRGRVVDITHRGGVIIESRAAFIQGALGEGSQVAGVLTMWQAPDATGTRAIPPGAILVVPGPLNFTMLRQAIVSGVSGVVASSILARDLEGFLRTDIVQLIDSVDVELTSLHLPPLTILLTEGLGTLAMPARTMNLLSEHLGSIALLSGATSIRQGIYPELIISLPAMPEQWRPVQPDPLLVLGAQVRVCSGDSEGVIGEVEYLFSHQQVFPSGVRARAARLRLEDGSVIVVPVTIIERIG